MTFAARDIATRAFRTAFRDGRPLRGYVDEPAGETSGPVVVACHGFKGFAEWGFLPTLGAELAASGITVVRFNFSGTGRDLGDELVTDLEAFRRNTLSQELSELAEVVDRLPEISPGVDLTKIGLFGHSRGGAIALLTTANRGARALAHAPRGLVTWSALAHFDRLSPREIAYWRERGDLPFLHERTGQTLSLGIDLLEDLEARPEKFDLERAARERLSPWLIVHGEADETVPVTEGHTLARAADPSAETLWVPGANHGLDGRHPFPGVRPTLRAALDATTRFLVARLDAR